MPQFVSSLFGLAIYGALVYIGARMAQLIDHMDDGRWYSSVMEYVELCQIIIGLVMMVCTVMFLVKWIMSNTSK